MRTRASLVGLLSIVAALLGTMGPAAAAPAAGGTEATGAIFVLPGGGGSSVQVRVDCPPAPQSATGSPSAGSTTVSGVTASCTATSASVTGTGATAGGVTFGAFSATCAAGATTTGSVTVLSGPAPVVPGTYTTPTTFTSGGATISLNEVSVGGGFVTRTAIHLTASDGSQAFIGQVVCPSPPAYPLAVDTASAASPAAAAPALAPLSASGGSSHTALLVAVGVGVLVLAQVAVALGIRRRRDGSTTA